MLSRYEIEVIATLDKEAQKEIERAARQVATVTAMVPIPWIDMLAAFGTNLRMIRRIGEIYGGRSGPIGSWRLLRSVSAHLMAAGALAVGMTGSALFLAAVCCRAYRADLVRSW